MDIKLMKGRKTRDGKNGILEFNHTETMMDMEEELVRVANGGTLKTGPAPRGERVRELEDKLEGTWGARR